MAFFGAAWAVYDEATIPWVADEIAYARSLISLGVPVLGICFGGQMLAAALGGTVSRAPIPEIGWVSVSSDEPALIEPGPWLEWHFDRFTAAAGGARRSHGRRWRTRHSSTGGRSACSSIPR